MKIIIATLFILSAKISYAGSFVDSLAKEYGKKNGCYSISMDKKGSNSKYIKNKSVNQGKSLNNNR